MEEALEVLRVILERRKLDTTTASVEGELDAVNMYTIGKVLVIFSEKEKTLVQDIVKYLRFAAENNYKDGIIIVSRSKPSENVLDTMKFHAKNGVQFFTLREIQYNATHKELTGQVLPFAWAHRVYMPHTIMKPEDAKKMMEQQNVLSPEQLPKIDSQDIQARLIGAMPGDIIHVLRHSDTVGQSDVWKLCVSDAHVNVGQ
uniref:RNA polymerase subunit H/Rpb5 C-terminal domain-containing protein n=1 Tax=viral metagenome TaxID=1070528 RepID=A0A6C0J7E8_9ZZZZ